MSEFKWEEIDFKSRHKGEHPTDTAYKKWQLARTTACDPAFIKKLEELYAKEMRLTAFILSQSKFGRELLKE